MNTPILYLIVPCYNEQDVLPSTSLLFLNKMQSLIRENTISSKSRILFINDGSTDATWEIIKILSQETPLIYGISLSRNHGHQNALLAGLLEIKDCCDIAVSIDCDGQDDINILNKMIAEYQAGCDIVYGVRENRDSDSLFKRSSAHFFYKLMIVMGVETVYNHADYRLISQRVLQAFSEFEEVNLFLRGIFPLVGFKSTAVSYNRSPRMAGKSHYSFSKMLALAIDGITSLSIKPLKIISTLGIFVSSISFIGTLWALIQHLTGNTVSGWASTICIICFVSGVQLICLGVVGEYIGKIFLEVKKRPRYIISEHTDNQTSSKPYIDNPSF